MDKCGIGIVIVIESWYMSRAGSLHRWAGGWRSFFDNLTSSFVRGWGCTQPWGLWSSGLRHCCDHRVRRLLTLLWRSRGGLTGVIFSVRVTGVCCSCGSCRRLWLWFGTRRRRSCSLDNRWLNHCWGFDYRLLDDRFFFDRCFGCRLDLCKWWLINFGCFYSRFLECCSGFIYCHVSQSSREMHGVPSPTYRSALQQAAHLQPESRLVLQPR